jgi:ankyrin repeat protein
VLHDFPYAVNARLSPRDDRRQPLHLAVLRRRPHVLRILLRRGADVRGRTASGKTALDLAYEGTCGHTVDLLQQAERGPHRRSLLCARIAASGDLTGLLPSIWRLMNPRP